MGLTREQALALQPGTHLVATNSGLTFEVISAEEDGHDIRVMLQRDSDKEWTTARESDLDVIEVLDAPKVDEPPAAPAQVHPKRKTAKG